MTGTGVTPIDFTKDRAAVARALDALTLRYLGERQGPVADAIRYALQGEGKRLRAVLVMSAHRAAGGTLDVSGLAAAVDYLEKLGLDRIAAAEHELLIHANERLQQIPGLTLIGTAADKCAVVSFTLEGVHPHDLGTILDHQGVAIRTGHHCAMPVMEFFGVPATARASFSFYNTHDEVERLADAVQLARGMFA